MMKSTKKISAESLYLVMKAAPSHAFSYGMRWRYFLARPNFVYNPAEHVLIEDVADYEIGYCQGYLGYQYSFTTSLPSPHRYENVPFFGYETGRVLQNIGCNDIVLNGWEEGIGPFKTILFLYDEVQGNHIQKKIICGANFEEKIRVFPNEPFIIQNINFLFVTESPLLEKL